MKSTILAYSILREVPSVETYRTLRSGSGLSPKTLEAAARGLPCSLFAVQVLEGATSIGMGRIVGDGGCFFQVVDIAVLKEHQGKGIGKMIMKEIVQYLETNVPESGYVSLIADGEAHKLYTRFGFEFTAPASVGMAFKPAESQRRVHSGPADVPSLA